LLGVLCLVGAAFLLWLAVGPAENLPVDSQEIESSMKEVQASGNETEALLQKLLEAGDDKAAREQLAAEMKREFDAMKRQQEERKARHLASLRRKRWGFAGFAGCLVLFAAKFLLDSVQAGSMRAPSKSETDLREPV
jgi:hypothetical protein